jgi:hypothetical protein
VRNMTRFLRGSAVGVKYSGFGLQMRTGSRSMRFRRGLREE